jgi:hypothetical protein
LAFFMLPEPPNPFTGVQSSLTPLQVKYILEQYKRQIRDWFSRCFQICSS